MKLWNVLKEKTVDKKTEEDYFIIRSGKTWAVTYKGKHYLYTDVFWYWNNARSDEKPQFIDSETKKIVTGWESFDEIEKKGLTDFIALSRPMVKFTDGGTEHIRILIQVEGVIAVTQFVHPYLYSFPVAETSLAAPYDLALQVETGKRLLKYFGENKKGENDES